MEYQPSHNRNTRPAPRAIPLCLQAWHNYLIREKDFKCYQDFRVYGGDYYDVMFVPSDLAEGEFYIDIYSIEVRREHVLRMPANLKPKNQDSYQEHALRILEFVNKEIIPDIF